MESNNPETSIVAGIVLILVGLSLYLLPWLIPLFYDMPERTTLPYYGILLAIEMTHFSRNVRQVTSESDLNEQ